MDLVRRLTLLGLAVVVVISTGCGDGSQTVTTTETVTTPETDHAPALSNASVPFVEGKLEALAVRELRAEGLVVRVDRSPNENVEMGRVFDQDPAAGTRVPSGSTVEIHVSTG